MITPRQDFKNHPTLAKGWQDRVDSAQFQEAVYAALLQMDIENQGVAGDMGSAAALHWRKVGALQFCRILMNLTASEAGTKRIDSDNLRHDLK